jgi:glycine cleavage system transcriptional repressor
VRSFAVSAIGQDRPGIVAGVTRVLLDHDMNIEDAQATILRGHFSLTMVVTGGSHVSEIDVLRDLESVRERLALEAAVVREIEVLDGDEPDATHVVTVFGLDRPGIVHAVCATLADAGISICDLNSRVIPAEDTPFEAEAEPIYGMMLEVAVEDPGAADGLARALDSIAGAAEIEITMRELEIG